MNNKKKKSEVLVVGAGGVGAYFGGRLSESGGAAVSVVCRSDYEAVKENGFDIASINGDFKFIPEQVCRNVDEYNGNPDYIIIALKALPDIDNVNLIKPAVRKDTVIVLLQNGIDIEHDLYEAYPENEIISGIAYIGVARKGEGKIEHQGGGHLSVGLFPEGTSDSVDRLHKLFENAGVDCEVRKDIIRKRWEKLLWNVPFNSLSVIAGGLDTRQIMDDKYLVNLAENSMKEVVRTSEACGWAIDESLIEWNLEYTRNFPPYKSSMLLDYENHRKMECDAILGNVIKLAEEHNLSTPYIEAMFALLNSINQSI
jgi:2-dehydropantoate 2-reductase